MTPMITATIPIQRSASYVLDTGARSRIETRSQSPKVCSASAQRIASPSKIVMYFDLVIHRAVRRSSARTVAIAALRQGLCSL